MFLKWTLIIRAQLFLLQDLACLQQHSNTHTQSSRETLTLLTGRLLLWTQSVQDLSSNKLRVGEKKAQGKRLWCRRREERKCVFYSSTQSDVLVLLTKAKRTALLHELMPSTRVILNSRQIPWSCLAFLHLTSKTLMFGTYWLEAGHSMRDHSPLTETTLNHK